MYQVIARLLLGVAVASGLNDGLLRTPLMGYNPWYDLLTCSFRLATIGFDGPPSVKVASFA